MATLQMVLREVQAVSPVLAAALVSSLWQGLLLVCGMALALRWLRGVPPAVRAALWAAMLCLLLLLPAWTLVSHPSLTPAAGHPGLHVANSWSVGLLAAWTMLSLLRAVQLGWRALRLQRLAHRAKPVAVPGELARLLEGRRRATLCVSAEVSRPSVAGFLHPRILLPEGLLETLSAAELAHVLLHEMEHLRRGDDWLNLLQQLGLLLLPMQPALLWVDRELCRERELACDDRVLAATRERKAYAACLVKLAEDSLLRKGLAPALSALGTRARESELVQRIRRILAGPSDRLGTARMRFALVALGTLAVASTVALQRSPEWVHFDGDAPPTTQAAVLAPSPAVSDSGRFASPVIHTVAGQAFEKARPVLASAVMNTRAGMGPHLVNALATTPMSPRNAPFTVTTSPRRHGKARPQKRDDLRHALPAEPAKSRPVLRATPWIQSAIQKRVADDDPAPARRVVLTEFEVVQPVYAAVAVSGGWLVFEL